MIGGFIIDRLSRKKSALILGLSIVYLPIMAAALTILMLKVKETRDADLGNVNL